MKVMINKFRVGFAVALATLIIGVFFASRSVLRNPSSSVKLAPAAGVAGRQISTNPDGWTKIEVDKEFSFYLPPDVKEEEPVGNIDYFGPQKSFSGKSLTAGYMYVEKWRNEELWRWRVSCDLLMERLAADPGFRDSEVGVASKRARKVTGKFDESEMVESHLCFRDLGNGTVLIFTTSYDEQRAADAGKIVGSIEFPY